MFLVPKKLSRSIGRTILRSKKNSPTVFFVGGTIGAVGATVLACRATIKAQPIVAEIKYKLEDNRIDQDRLETLGRHDRREYTKDRAYLVAQSVGRLAKPYAPALIVGTVSIAALTGSHISLKRRNTAVVAALGLATKALEEYRDRVAGAIGVDQEAGLYYGVEGEYTLDDEDPRAVYLNNAKRTREPLMAYRRFFDEWTPYWDKNPEYNRTFLLLQQNHVNNILLNRGHVFLNEVYDKLGFERVPEGQIIGWVYDRDNPTHISFGLDLLENSPFMKGIERSAWLHFNVDGVIYDLI